jgi:hypothetical protein
MPRILLKINDVSEEYFSFRTTFFMLVFCLTYSSALKMEVTRSTETSFDFQ